MAFALQVAIAAMVLGTKWGAAGIQGLANGVAALLSYANTGTEFLFGASADNPLAGTFALGALPVIIFFAALVSILYHVGVMQRVVRWVGGAIGWVTGISKVESLGAAAKAGSTPLNQVVGYGERVTERGFVHMDSPGYDPVSVTGQVAGGCNVVVFTTGRGSAFGFKPAPSIKIATNSTLYANQEPDMDINAGKVLDGITLDELGDEIFEKVLEVASGAQSKSEAAGVGQEEFNPWILGAML